MAEITLTMDEYKAMENSLAQKTKEAERLEKELEGLRGFSRVIVETQGIASISDFSSLVYRYFYGAGSYSRGSLSNAIQAAMDQTKIVSKQYVNFEDVKQEVFNKFQKEIESSIEHYNRSQELVADRITYLEQEYSEKSKALREEFQDSLAQKDKEIADLESKLTETSKSMEEKKSEFEAKKAAIEKELKDLEEKYQIKPNPEPKKKKWWQ